SRLRSSWSAAGTSTPACPSGSPFPTFPRRTCALCSRPKPRARNASSGVWFRAGCSSMRAHGACTERGARLREREGRWRGACIHCGNRLIGGTTMLPKVSAQRFSSAHLTSIEGYRHLVGDELFEELRTLARELNGVRVCHINSTGFGGGVAELLARL